MFCLCGRTAERVNTFRVRRQGKLTGNPAPTQTVQVLRNIVFSGKVRIKRRGLWKFTTKIKSQAVNMLARKLPAFVVYTFAPIKADVIRAPV